MTITKIIYKNIEFHWIIMKIMKMIEFHNKNNENNEDRRIPIENQYNNSNLKQILMITKKV